MGTILGVKESTILMCLMSTELQFSQIFILNNAIILLEKLR